MTFYERFEATCKSKNLDPTGRELEKIMKERITTFSRTTPNKWKTGGNNPKSEFITALADILEVSTDYLLCRTDDPTDYAHQPKTLTETEKRLLQMFRQMDTAVAEDCLRYCEFALMKQEDNRKKALEAG